MAAIAERAGLTERTFFRYFADKREVLFSSTDLPPRPMTAALVERPIAVPPDHGCERLGRTPFPKTSTL